MNYMDTQGMRSVGERLYLVENFTTGGGLVTMLRVLRYYYQVHLKRPIMPDVTLLGMSILFGTDQKVGSCSRIEKTGTLTIDAKVEGMPKIQIQSYPLGVNNTVLRGLDLPLLQDHFSKEVGLPACNWNENYKEIIAKGGAFHEQFYKWLRQETLATLKGYESAVEKSRFKELVTLSQASLIDIVD